MVPQAKILITDDHRMFAEGLRAMLMSNKNLAPAHIAGSGKEALSMLSVQHYDLLISDINMPEMSGIELTQHVKKKYPDVKILVITMHDEQEIVNEILLSEAEGYILKNTSREEFFYAIGRILNNNTYYSNDVLNVLLKRVKMENKSSSKIKQLTDREIEIIKLIAMEFSSEQIAEKLFISKHTVDTHRKNILQKTETRTLVGLIRFAYENNLI